MVLIVLILHDKACVNNFNTGLSLFVLSLKVFFKFKFIQKIPALPNSLGNVFTDVDAAPFQQVPFPQHLGKGSKRNLESPLPDL